MKSNPQAQQVFYEWLERLLQLKDEEKLWMKHHANPANNSRTVPYFLPTVKRILQNHKHPCVQHVPTLGPHDNAETHSGYKNLKNVIGYTQIANEIRTARLAQSRHAPESVQHVPPVPPAEWVQEWKRMQQTTMDLVDARLLVRFGEQNNIGIAAPPPPASPAESPPSESPLVEASVSHVSTKKRGRSDYERQQRQTWKTRNTSSWKPRMKAKNDTYARARVCNDSFPGLYCCKKVGG